MAGRLKYYKNDDLHAAMREAHQMVADAARKVYKNEPTEADIVCSSIGIYEHALLELLKTL